jgi:regulator of sigma E protease
MTTVLAFLFALALLVFIHELGHYSVARWCGVKVLRFSVGFGKPLVRWTVGPDRTEWTIAAIPLGGYVRMLDEREGAPGSEHVHDLHRAFNRQPLGRRALIVAAGPAANFILAIALYASLGIAGLEEPAAVVAQPPQATPAAAAGLQAGDRIVGIDRHAVRSLQDARLRLLDGMVQQRPVELRVQREGAVERLTLPWVSVGQGEIDRDFLGTLGILPQASPVTIASVTSDGSAAAAGLRAGDQVLEVDQRPIARSQELIEVLRVSAGREVMLTVVRGGEERNVVVVPTAHVPDRAGDEARPVGRIGASLRHSVEMVEVRHGPVSALGYGAAQTWDMSWFSLRMLGRMLIGDLSWRNLSGPVTIADYAGQTAQVGWAAYVAFLALVSVSLGVLNLLPVPILDGGHLVYYGLEAIKGRPLSERFMAVTQRAGLAVIGALMFVALFNDLTRLFGG